MTLRRGGLVSLYGDREALPRRPRRRQRMTMMTTIRAKGMVTPIMTLDAVDSPGSPWSDIDPAKLAASEGSSMEEMRGDGASSSLVDVDDGTISDEGEAESVVDRVLLPLCVVAVEASVGKVVARVS